MAKAAEFNKLKAKLEEQKKKSSTTALATTLHMSGTGTENGTEQVTISDSDALAILMVSLNCQKGSVIDTIID